MKLKFYGVFGSVPRPIAMDEVREEMLSRSPATYGGNTTCLEVIAGDGKEFIFDAGTGIVKLGLQLMGRGFAPGKNGKAALFLTHQHYDHIQGMPFFVPAYIPTNEIAVYSEPKVSKTAKEILSGQMAVPYFPVKMDIQRGLVEFHEIGPGQIIRDSMEVEAIRSNHPDSSLIYAACEAGKKIVFATDYEHDGQILGKRFGPRDNALIELAKGAEMIIYDCQFTPLEYIGGDMQRFGKVMESLQTLYHDPATGKPFSEMSFDERKVVLAKELPMSKIGWGHSNAKHGIDIALAAGAKALVLTHHNPLNTDKKIDEIVEQAEQELQRRGMVGSLRIVPAYDGLEMQV
ncbi:MBL fold metallo-hydrolase [Candidatus Woesearchaeota archaeon]|nr:MBL fold metallo-hydrolase [Candidatus Woesearchaeota archaeon]